MAAEAASIPSETDSSPSSRDAATFQSELVLTNPPVAQTATLTYTELFPCGRRGERSPLAFSPASKDHPLGHRLPPPEPHRHRPEGLGHLRWCPGGHLHSGTSVSQPLCCRPMAAPVNGTGPGDTASSTPHWSQLRGDERGVGLRPEAGCHRPLEPRGREPGDAGDPITFKVDVWDGDTGQLAGLTVPPTLSPRRLDPDRRRPEILRLPRIRARHEAHRVRAVPRSRRRERRRRSRTGARRTGHMGRGGSADRVVLRGTRPARLAYPNRPVLSQSTPRSSRPARSRQLPVFAANMKNAGGLSGAVGTGDDRPADLHVRRRCVAGDDAPVAFNACKAFFDPEFDPELRLPRCGVLAASDPASREPDDDLT